MKTHRILAGLLLALTFGQPLPRLLAAVQGEENPATQFAKSMVLATKKISEDHLKPVSQGQLVVWAVEGMFKGTKESMPISISKRLASLDKANEAALFLLLRDAHDHLAQRKKWWKPQQDLNMALRAVFACLEPEHELKIKLDGQPIVCWFGPDACGVGAILASDSPMGFVKVATPVLDSPAHKAGIREGDLITKIASETNADGSSALDEDGNPRVTSTKGLAPESAVGEIVGQKGTKVRLTILRAGVAKPFEIELVRQVCPPEHLFGFKRKLDGHWDYFLDQSKKIAYIHLSTINHRGQEFVDLVQSLNKQGMGGLILDLRFNPGGLLGGGVKIAGALLPEGPFCTVKNRTGKAYLVPLTGQKKLLTTPLVCLVNAETKSVAEMIVACLQDKHRTKVMGVRSAGEVEIRTICEFDGGAIWIPTAYMQRPGKTNLSKLLTLGNQQLPWGVQPDTGFSLPLSAQEHEQLALYLMDKEMIHAPAWQPQEPAFQDRQLEMAADYLRDLLKKNAK